MQNESSFIRTANATGNRIEGSDDLSEFYLSLHSNKITVALGASD
jgi:hypothetical protein